MRYRLLLTFAFLALSLAGCTKEDLSVCSVSTSFRCKFDMNNDSEDKFSKLINKVDLYIFDASGLLVRHISDVQDNFPEDYHISTDLKSGTYTAVIYGTVNNNDGVVVGVKQDDPAAIPLPMKEGVSRIEDVRLMLNSIDGYTDKDLQAVLHGILAQCTITSRLQTHNVSFIRNTSTVELNVSGLDYLIADPAGAAPTRAESDITVRIEGNNKAYFHDNTLDMELGKAIYAPYSQQFSSDILTSQLSVLRLFKELPMELKIYNAGKLIWQLNLTDEIMKSPEYSTNEDLDREDKFVVKVIVNTAGDFTISVNGWTTTSFSTVVG